VRSLQAMELFDRLFDDETLLGRPEANPLSHIVADHRELRAAHRSQLATLVVPDSQLTAVSRQLPTGSNLPVSVITTGGAGGLLALAGRDLPGIDIVSVEPTLRDLDDLVGSAARVISAAGELGSDVDIFVGLPYAPGWEAAVEPIEAAGLYGKIGAVGPSATAEQLSILVEADLPFKITSRMEWDWLAMFRAIRALVDGASQMDAVGLLEDPGHEQTATAISSWDQATQSGIRRRLRRVGTDRLQQLINDLAGRGVPAAPGGRHPLDD
jgi:hypothetical protein